MEDEGYEGMTTRFEEWEAERLQDPRFLAALEKQYPKSQRDEAQARITALVEENEKQRGVIEMLMERCRWLQEESGTLHGALEAAPKPWASGKPFSYWRWWWKVRGAALKEAE